MADTTPPVTKKLCSLLGGCPAKRHNQAKEREKEGFIPCSKYGEHRGSSPKQCLREQQHWGNSELRVHAYS